MDDHSGAQVVAVISAFHPPQELPGRVRRLTQQVAHVVVVDDGSDPTGVDPCWADLEAAGATLLRLERNSGIAAALNQGIQTAITLWKPGFILTLDQDSELDIGYVAAALKTYSDATRSGIAVGLVAAQSHNKRDVPLLARSSVFQEAFDPLQSGAIIPLSTFEKVGMLDERLFIDCVDSEFNLRIRSHGMATLVGLGCNMEHALGHARPMTILGWHISVRGIKRHVHYHAPFRVYYITRNSVYLWRLYGLLFPGWLLRRLRFQMESDGFRLLYGPKRRQQIIAILRGFADGLRGHLGEIDAALKTRIGA